MPLFKKKKPGPIRSRAAGSDLIVLVHGIAGSVEGTWKHMLKVLGEDPELGGYSIDCYGYPTKLFNHPFRALPGIQEIANGLKTFISTQHHDKKRVVLVGHSLGGLVVRQLILDLAKGDAPSVIVGAVLYASPNTGSSLANIGKLFSWHHRHLHQLCKRSDLLSLLNQDWVRLQIESRTRMLYVIGGKDSVVESANAAWQIAATNAETLIDHGHLSIKEPADAEDIRYKVLKRFVLLNCPNEPDLASGAASPVSKGDVLFDVYSSAVEDYYIARDEDRTLASAARTFHIWLSGRSGLGKTAALRRLIERSGWNLHHVTLGAFLGLDSLCLLRELSAELCERADTQPPFPANTPPELHQILAGIKKALTKLSANKAVAILVEEIPLSSGDEFTNLLKALSHVASSSETNATPNRVVWLFSSINDPRPSLPPGSAKFLERVQLLSFDSWKAADAARLVDLIEQTLRVDLSHEDKELLLDSAEGNPRLIKMVFRRKRNEQSANKRWSELIAEVRVDFQ